MLKCVCGAIEKMILIETKTTEICIVILWRIFQKLMKVIIIKRYQMWLITEKIPDVVGSC